MAIESGSYDPVTGIWSWCRPPAQAPRPAHFLDRDGVLVEETGYLCRAADTVMIDGAARVVAAANRSGIAVVVVTNQAGIGRGYYDWAGFLEVETRIAARLAGEGAALDGLFACPFHPDGIGGFRHPGHPARKPQPGMLLEAAARLDLQLGRSWIAGDHGTDLSAGAAAGLRGGIHVLTGHGRVHREAAENLRTSGFQVLLADSIAGVLPLLPRLFP